MVLAVPFLHPNSSLVRLHPTSGLDPLLLEHGDGTVGDIGPRRTDSSGVPWKRKMSRAFRQPHASESQSRDVPAVGKTEERYQEDYKQE